MHPPRGLPWVPLAQPAGPRSLPANSWAQLILKLFSIGFPQSATAQFFRGGWGGMRANQRWSLDPGGVATKAWRGGVTSLIGQLCSRTGCKSPWTPPPVAPIPVLTCNWLSFQGGGTRRGLVPLKGWERLRAHLSLGWSLQTAGAAVPRTILLSSVMACVSAGTPPQGSGWRGGRQLGGCGQSGS